MQNHIVSTFQKHINAQMGSELISPANTKMPLELHHFSEDIKGANEFIGVLQVANLALKKLERFTQNNEQEAISGVVENTTFMGMKIFNSEFSTRLNAKSFHIELDSNSLNSVESIQDKMVKIQQMLLEISDELIADSTPSGNAYDFNSFNANAFKPQV